MTEGQQVVTAPRKRKTNRRGQGEGSIFQRGTDGRWVAVLDLGRDETGKRQRKAFYGHSYEEARDTRAKYQSLLAQGKALPDLQQTVGAWLDYWVTTILPGTVKASTLEHDTWMVGKHIKPSLGAIKLGKLEETHVNTWLRKLENIGLSPATRVKARMVLLRAMRDAVQYRKIPHNPVLGVKPPKVAGHKTSDAIGLDDGRVLTAATRGHRFEAAILLGLWVGLRRGEVLALKWADIDLDNGEITVRATLRRINGVGLVVDTPKTEAGKRVVGIPGLCVNALKARRDQQRFEKKDAGSSWVDSQFVFTTRTGGPVDPRNLLNQFHAVTEKAGLGRMRFHALRHSSVRIAKALGVALDDISENLGHASYAITKDIYGSLPASERRRGADAIDAAFGA